MTSPTPLSREELIELAALDVFGLLDEYEAALYTRSYHHAPTVVQDEILALQAELAEDQCLLPDEEPDGHLRDRVLDTLSRAMEREVESLRPIATIGRPQPSADIYVAGTPGRRAIASFFWRAAAFVLASGLIVVLYFNAQLQTTGNEIAKEALKNITSERLAEMVGPGMAEFAENPQCRAISFELDADNGVAGSSAVVWINDETNEAFVFVMGLPQDNANYTVTLTDPAGDDSAREFTFVNNLLAVGMRIDNVSASLLATASWSITDDAGHTLMRSI